MDKIKCMKKVIEVMLDGKEPKYLDFEEYIPETQDFAQLLYEMQENGYIKGFDFARAKGKPSIPFIDKDAKVTDLGIKFYKN
ncbi:YjcQ family protein [Tissierella pigra]|nr:YjcQ family protein [Tissierella pigra]